MKAPIIAFNFTRAPKIAGDADDNFCLGFTIIIGDSTIATTSTTIPVVIPPSTDGRVRSHGTDSRSHGSDGGVGVLV